MFSSPTTSAAPRSLRARERAEGARRAGRQAGRQAVVAAGERSPSCRASSASAPAGRNENAVLVTALLAQLESRCIGTNIYVYTFPLRPSVIMVGTLCGVQSASCRCVSCLTWPLVEHIQAHVGPCKSSGLAMSRDRDADSLIEHDAGGGSVPRSRVRSHSGSLTCLYT